LTSPDGNLIMGKQLHPVCLHPDLYSFSRNTIIPKFHRQLALKYEYNEYTKLLEKP
jgi:hypothetical protein